MRAVRRKTAEHLSAAWATIPHVTQHDLADITALEELRKQLREAGRSGRRQPDGHRDRGEGRRGRAEGVPAVQRVDRHGRRRDHLQEVREHRRRRRHRSRPARAGHPRRRHEEHHPDLGRARAARPRRRARARSRSTRCRAAASASRTSAASAARRSRRSSTRRKSRSSASRARAWSRSTGTAQFVPRLMLPLSLSYDHRVDRRRRRHPLPALGRRGARAAVPAGAAGMTHQASHERRDSIDNPAHLHLPCPSSVFVPAQVTL